MLLHFACAQGDFVAASELKVQLDDAKRAAEAAEAAEADVTGSEVNSLPPIRIASLGGGPGNDALGCLLFASLCVTNPTKGANSVASPVQASRPKHLRRLQVTVYDFCRDWEEIVRQVGAALPMVMASITDELPSGSSRPSALQCSLGFALCDLQLPPSSATNVDVTRSASEVDLIVCSFCCHESGAATKRPLSANLLGQLLQEMKYGAALLVIDLWEKSINEVAELIDEKLKDGVQHSNGSFVVIRLGSSRNFPFKGLFAVKSPKQSNG